MKRRKADQKNLLVILCLMGMSFNANSHAILVKSIPAENEIVGTAPEKIEVWFNEGVGSEYKALAVIDSKGKRVDNHDVEQGLTDKAYLYATVGKLEPGKYTVRYRVVSKDSHIITGKFQFSIGQ